MVQWFREEWNSTILIGPAEKPIILFLSVTVSVLRKTNKKDHPVERVQFSLKFQYISIVIGVRDMRF